jgi:hypothetical protein
MVSFGEAAATAALIEEKQPCDPPGLTHRVAAIPAGQIPATMAHTETSLATEELLPVIVSLL